MMKMAIFYKANIICSQERTWRCQLLYSRTSHQGTAFCKDGAMPLKNQLRSDNLVANHRQEKLDGQLSPPQYDRDLFVHNAQKRYCVQFSLPRKNRLLKHELE